MTINKTYFEQPFPFVQQIIKSNVVTTMYELKQQSDPLFPRVNNVQLLPPMSAARMLVIFVLMIITGGVPELICPSQYAKLFNTPEGQDCVLNIKVPNTSQSCTIILPPQFLQLIKPFEPEFMKINLAGSDNTVSHDKSDDLLSNEKIKVALAEGIINDFPGLEQKHITDALKVIQQYFGIQSDFNAVRFVKQL